MTPVERDIYRFADVEVDMAQGSVKRGPNEMHLRQQAFQVLLYLLERRGRLVTKEELMGQIWKETAVTNDALVQCIGDIRRALGDDPRQPRFIKTVPRVGYRFISSVERLTHNVPSNGGGVAIATEEITTIEVEYEEEPSIMTLPSEKVIQSPAVIAGRRQLNRKLVLASASIVLLALIVSSVVYLRQRFRASRADQAEIMLPRVPGKHAIAVMYLDNQSGGTELDWLREGLADMFITNLSRAKNLNVLNRQQLHLLLERAGQHPGDKIELDKALDVARRSRAEVILLGSFARFGERLRLDVQLYDAQNNQNMASESLNVDRIEQLPTQVDLLALKLAAQLGAASGDRERLTTLSESMTDNLEAYRYYSLALDKAFAVHSTDAIALLEKAVALDPQFAMAHARIGYVYAVMWSRPEEGKPYLEKAFRLSARLTERDRQLISAWYAIANHDYLGAIRAFREVITDDPLDIEAYWRLARLLVGESQYQDAIDVLQKALAVDAEAKEIYNALGGLYAGLGRHDEAAAMHQRYVQLAPDEPNAYDSLGMSFQCAGRYQEAVEAYNHALALKPNFDVALIHLANTYAQMGRYREALRLYQEYIQIAPADPERGRGYGSIATVYTKLGDLYRAEQAARKEMRFAERGYARGSLTVALARGDTPLAERLLRQVLAVTPDERGGRGTSRFNYYFSGQLALLKGRDLEALENFQALVKCLPHTYHIDTYEDALANAYLMLGRLDEAINEYERVLRFNPNYPLAHYHLARAYELKSLREEALTNYGRFLEVWKGADADIPEVIAARKAING